MQQKMSSYEMNNIYLKDIKSPHQKLEINLGPRRQSKEEYNTKPDSGKSDKKLAQEYMFYSGEHTHSNRRDLIEVRTFLPTKPDKMISSRYENSLTQLKEATKRWKVCTLFLFAFSLTYFSLNLWATLTLFDLHVLSAAPRLILQVSNILLQVQDVVFYSYTLNIAMDIWAILICIGLTVMLMRETTSEIEKRFEERGFCERLVLRVLATVVILFGLGYMAGTGYVLYEMSNQAGTRDLINIVIFHSSKLIYLLLNVIAYKQYKAKKYVYEDILLEALEPSDMGDDKSETEDKHNHFGNHAYPSEV